MRVIILWMSILMILVTSCSNQGEQTGPSLEDVGTVSDVSNDLAAQSDLHQEHDVLADINTDAEIDDTVAPVPDYWAHIINRCADVATELPARPQGEITSPPANLTATLSWQKSVLCPVEFPGVRDLDSTPGTLTMANYQGKSVIFEVLESSFEPLPGYGVRAIARIDPASGDSLGCLTNPDVSGVVGPPMHINPRDGDSPLLVLRTYQDGGTYETNPVMSWWSTLWQTEERLPIPISYKTSTPETYLLPDGQLLILLDGERVASVDSSTGQVNWVVRPSDIQSALGLALPVNGVLFRYSTRFDPTTRKIHMRVFFDTPNNSSYKERNILIDHCGGVEESFDSIKSMLTFGDGFLEIGHNELGYKISTLDVSGDLKSVLNCQNVISLEDDRVACLNISKQRTLTLSILQWPDKISEIVLNDPIEPDGSHVIFSSKAIALRDRLIVVQSNHFDSNIKNPFQKLRFVDWATGEVLTHLDIPIPSDEIGWSSSLAPVVDDQGNLAISMQGYLFGIATNTTGLSPTRFPRGIYLGGNRNLGVW